jgi:hypothetical protein
VRKSPISDFNKQSVTCEEKLEKSLEERTGDIILNW